MLRQTNGYKERKIIKEMLPEEWFDEKLTKIITNGKDDGMNYKERLLQRLKNKFK